MVTEARAAAVRLSVVGAVHAAQHGGRGEGEMAASSVGEGVSLQELHGRWRQGWRRRRCLFSQPLGLLRSLLGHAIQLLSIRMNGGNVDQLPPPAI